MTEPKAPDTKPAAAETLPKVERLGDTQMDAVVKVSDDLDLPLREVVQRAAKATDLERREDLLRRAQPALQMGAQIEDMLRGGNPRAAMELVARRAGIPLDQIVPTQQRDDQGRFTGGGGESDPADQTAAELARERLRVAELSSRLERIERKDGQAELMQSMNRELGRFKLYQGSAPDVEFRRQNALNVVTAALAAQSSVEETDVRRAVEAYHSREVRTLEQMEATRVAALRQNAQAPRGIDPGAGLPELSQEDQPTMADLQENGGRRFKEKMMARLTQLNASRTRLGT